MYPKIIVNSVSNDGSILENGSDFFLNDRETLAWNK